MYIAAYTTKYPIELVNQSACTIAMQSNTKHLASTFICNTTLLKHMNAFFVIETVSDSHGFANVQKLCWCILLFCCLLSSDSYTVQQ